MGYGKGLLIAIDQLINALFGGWPDETMSSRAYRLSLNGIGWPRRIIDCVAGFLGDKDHCLESYASERNGRQLPPELRQVR